jgi:hypothetical protein
LNARESVDEYHSWQYDDHDCHCYHLVRAIWLDLTGADIGDRTPSPDTALRRHRAFRSGVKQFQAVAARTDPSIVYMEPNFRGGLPHVGVYLRGKIAHLNRSGFHHQAPADIPGTHSIKGWYVP